jgi:hypothetical protein
MGAGRPVGRARHVWVVVLVHHIRQPVRCLLVTDSRPAELAERLGRGEANATKLVIERDDQRLD